MMRTGEVGRARVWWAWDVRSKLGERMPGGQREMGKGDEEVRERSDCGGREVFLFISDLKKKVRSVHISRASQYLTLRVWMEAYATPSRRYIRSVHKRKYSRSLTLGKRSARLFTSYLASLASKQA